MENKKVLPGDIYLTNYAVNSLKIIKVVKYVVNLNDIVVIFLNAISCKPKIGVMIRLETNAIWLNGDHFTLISNETVKVVELRPSPFQ